ncbi:MAG TPA: response regulator transcription factor [Chitinophagaceae bacterium]|jgi:DNA-binding NarL/FixJ family response regulator|nr:response regulator transcription factor [Chitinophagaceae bacterium]
MEKTITLALVDDHQIVIDGLLSLLHGEPWLRVAFATTDPASVTGKLALQPVDILLTDVMMPGLSGVELAKAVKKGFPEVRILALSMNGEGDMVSRMVNEADVAGYLLKNTGKKELLDAIGRIAQGGIYFSDAVLQELERMDRRKQEVASAHLSERELEIIRLIEKEFSNRQIAETLFISERTVETHRKNILRKTNTSSVVGLIKYAYEHRLIEKSNHNP